MTITESELPFITVAMPVRNESAHIEGVLRELLDQDYPRDKYEIIVADGQSTDNTPHLVQTVASRSSVPIRLFENPKRLSSAGRNIGITNGRGDIVVFVDGHCYIGNRQMLRQLAEVMKDTAGVCLCRPQPLDAPGSNQFQKMIAACRASALGHGLDSSIYDPTGVREIDPTSSGAAYRREVFDKIGIYDESFDACEDVEFNHRVWKSGMKSFISPAATIHYAPRKDLAGLFKQMSRYGYGRFRFISKHSDGISLGQLIPPGFIAWLLTAAMLSFFWTWPRYVLGITMLVYATAVFSASLILALRNGPRYLIGGLAIFPTIHFGLGYGFLKALILRRAPKR